MHEHIELKVAETLMPVLSVHKNDEILDVMSNMRPKFSELTSASRDVTRAYLLSCILKKWKGFIGIHKTDTRAVCIEEWFRAEQQCFATNYKLKTLDNPITDSPIDRCIRAVRENVVSMIGKRPNITQCISMSDWPTGATYSTRKGQPVHSKLTDTTTSTTPACYFFAREVYRCTSVAYTLCNRFATVPKTCKTDRPIACEPALNAFLQKGAGRMIRRLLLKNANVNLNTQATENRDLAYLALSCDLATIDLRSASDTISYELVKLILPPAWFDYLVSLRTPYTEMDNKRILLEKFAGMGNGFTFELETVIFRAILMACYQLSGVDGPLAVFGDDIVCSKRIFTLSVSVLTFFGFTVNEDKTFSHGLFYESCGRDYFCEEDISPCYVKDVCTSLAQYIVLHNKLFRWALRTNDHAFVAKALSLIRKEARIKFKLKELPRQPAILSADLGFISEHGFRYDKHGDVILKLCLIKSDILQTVEEQSFYMQNWLRGGKSFTTTDGRSISLLQTEVSRLKHNVKAWLSSSEDISDETWVVES